MGENESFNVTLENFLGFKLADCISIILGFLGGMGDGRYIEILVKCFIRVVFCFDIEF